jgi:hypothetical protein
MSDSTAPDRRYRDGDLQAAYEQGWHQEYDHSSFELLERAEGVLDDVPDEAERCRRRAAWLEGAADALLELADRQHEGAAIAQAWEASAS